MNKPTRWGRWEAQLVPVSKGKKNPPPFTLCPLHPAAPAKSGALKNNGSTFRRKEGEDADNFLRSAEKDTLRKGHSSGPSLPAGAFRDPPRRHTPAAAGLGPPRGRQCLHLSRGRWEKQEAGAEPQTSARRPGGNAGAQLGAGGRRGEGRATAARRARLALLGRARDAERRATLLQALPAAFRTRGEERSPRRSSQARTRADAGRCSRPGRLAGPGLPHPGSAAAALTWLVPGGRDGHGLAARGGTGSPGKDRLLGR